MFFVATISHSWSSLHKPSPTVSGHTYLNTLDIHAESRNYSDNWKLRVKLGARWGSSLKGRVTRSVHCIWNQKIIGWKSTDSAVVLKDLVQLGAY